ncbi:MAG: PAS domain-containing sensor histidine kinase [Sedimentisphaerales bacterium]|nr:PAS domain-containing sensor histidine kinase [Sedimentisphaerales bacterium]
MQANRPVVRRVSAARRELLRGDSWFAVLIFAVVVVFMLSLIASVWNNITFQRDVRQKAGVQRLKAVGNVLSRAAEALMAADEISMLRRVIVEAGTEHKLKFCRIVLPGGGVLADADPAGITALHLPASWPDEVLRPTEQVKKKVATLTFPLIVTSRGSATLALAGSIGNEAEGGVTPQTAQMAIACLALASMLLVHRHARFRLKAIGAIQEILLAATGEHADLSTLELDPNLGAEAVAWNKLLGEKQNLQVSTAIQHVKEAVREKSGASDALSSAFDAVPYGLVLVNDRMQVEHVNGAAAVLLQKERAQMLRADISSLVSDQRVLDVVRDVVANPASKRAVITAEQGGSITKGVLKYTICPVRREDSRLGLAAIEDITQQKVAEAAMNSFLAKAAHELRTPLTNVRLLVEDTLERCHQDPASTGTNLNVINEETQRLERTVSEILSASQIEAGCFELRADDVHVDQLLQQLKSDHEPQARDRKIALEFELPPKLPILQADRDKMSLVLHNLLGNALKYTLEGGRVVVAATVEKGRLSVAVSDTGIGISAEEHERVFEKFYRCNNPLATHVKGSGLGLAIARDVARLHGGDITLESEPGKGSTFTLVLPVIEEGA